MSITLRARFPNGRFITLSNIIPSLPYADLLALIQQNASLPEPPHKVLLAGPPRRPILSSPQAEISTLLSNGDSIIVEPKPLSSTEIPSTRIRGGRGKTRAKKRGQTSHTNTRSNVARVSALKDLPKSQPEEHDEDNSPDWSPDLTTDSSSAHRPKRRRVSASANHLLQSSAPNEVSPASNSLSIGIGFEDGIRATEGRMGAALKQSLDKDEADLDVCGKAFRNSLKDALARREAEAEGERRYEAWLSKRYELKYVAGNMGFLVRYRSLKSRVWTDECDGKMLVSYPKELLAAAFRAVFKEDSVVEDRENLRARCMAICSPRSFWNMVRLFDDDIESGLRKLVPEIDWSFLESRRRMTSEKGKRYAENKLDMGWTSD